MFNWPTGEGCFLIPPEQWETSMPDEANMLLRSAYAIAAREGVSVNWEAFKVGLLRELLKQAGDVAGVDVTGTDDEQTILRATCTPRTYRVVSE